MTELDRVIRSAAVQGARSLGAAGQSLAEDVAQELWLMVMRKAGQIKPDEPIRPLLVGAAKRIVMAQARKLLPLDEKRDGDENKGMDAADVALSRLQLIATEHPRDHNKFTSGLLSSHDNETEAAITGAFGGVGVSTEHDPVVFFERKENISDMAAALDFLISRSDAQLDFAPESVKNGDVTQGTVMPMVFSGADIHKRANPGADDASVNPPSAAASEVPSQISRVARSVMRANKLPDVSTDLRYIRQILHVTQEEMAKRLGVSASVYCACEYGRSKAMAAKLLPLAKKLVAEQPDEDEESLIFAGKTVEEIVNYWRSLPEPGTMISLHDLQSYVHVNKSTLSRWLSGKEEPKPETLLRCDTMIRHHMKKIEEMDRRRESEDHNHPRHRRTSS